MTLLEARGLSVTPPGALTPAVKDFTLAIGRGEWIAVTGPNGGGKTSLLLGLAGLWPASGYLALAGVPLAPGCDPLVRRGLAVVLQDPSSQTLQPTVGEEIAFGSRNMGLDPDEVARRVTRWSGVFGLEGDLERDPAKLSAGRQQLVLLAAALAGEPDVLIADEATAHLDRGSRGQVLVQVRDRVANGMSVIWATQLSDELSVADRNLPIGSPLPSPSPPRPPQAAARTRLHIRVRPQSSDDGPRVATDRPIAIEVPERGVTGIVGRNGAGKSVILWAAAGLDLSAQLELEWNGRREPPPIAALQFPELQIFEEDPAAEVTFAAEARGMPHASALEVARNYFHELSLDMDRMSERRTWGLAAGEKRMLEIVAALISPACLCVLDEPTAGLDASRRTALARLVRQVSDQTPILIASQDRDWLSGLASVVHDLDGPFGQRTEAWP
jgi:energy-coupling factor transporter ATP-binding protein EcfA2